MIPNFPTYFEPQLVEEILSYQEVKTPKDTILVEEGDLIGAIPLLSEGLIRVLKDDESGRQIQLYEIHQGESCILSITSALNHKKSEAKAVVSNDSVLRIIHPQVVEDWVNRYAGFRRFVFELYHKRFAEVLQLVDAVSFKKVDERLREYLLHSQREGEVAATHKEIADRLGTAREVVSRLLKELENQGHISLKRGQIIINKSLNS